MSDKMDDFYTDEPIGWRPPDNLDDEGNVIPDDDDADHRWDYYEPEDDEQYLSWLDLDGGNVEPDGPDRIQQLLAMIRRNPWELTANKSFYEQAKFMEDFDDDAPIVYFDRTFPTYSEMSTEQLRSYFTIRKMLRHGQFPDVSISYIFVYVYETLMQIGIKSPEEGYEILQELQREYSHSYLRFKLYMTSWIRDYVVYYNLKDHFKEIFDEEWQSDEIASILKNYKNVDDNILVSAFSQLGKYDITNSVLFKKAKDKALKGTAVALRAALHKLERDKRRSLTSLCFGELKKKPTIMFSNAVFFKPDYVVSAEIQISPYHIYICDNGLWAKEEYVRYGKTFNFKQEIKSILRDIDCQMRIILNVKPRLKQPKDPLPYHNDIYVALVDWVNKEKRDEAAREFERRKINIDFSKLNGIRTDAEVIQEKLLETSPNTASPSPSEGGETEATSAPVKPPANGHDASPNPSEGGEMEVTSAPVKPLANGHISISPPLEGPWEVSSEGSGEVSHFLRLFLSGGDWKKYLRDIHMPEGVMVENINNKAMDEIGDIVLEDDGSGLRLIEDYREDVENMIKDSEQQ